MPGADIAFPQLQNPPARALQRGDIPPVAVPIRCDLVCPVRLVRFWLGRELARVAVPKASLDQHDFHVPREHDVRFPWQVLPMKSKSIAHHVQ